MNMNGIGPVWCVYGFTAACHVRSQLLRLTMACFPVWLAVVCLLLVIVSPNVRADNVLGAFYDMDIQSTVNPSWDVRTGSRDGSINVTVGIKSRMDLIEKDLCSGFCVGPIGWYKGKETQNAKDMAVKNPCSNANNTGCYVQPVIVVDDARGDTYIYSVSTPPDNKVINCYSGFRKALYEVAECLKSVNTSSSFSLPIPAPDDAENITKWSVCLATKEKSYGFPVTIIGDFIKGNLNIHPYDVFLDTCREQNINYMARCEWESTAPLQLAYRAISGQTPVDVSPIRTRIFKCSMKVSGRVQLGYPDPSDGIELQGSGGSAMCKINLGPDSDVNKPFIFPFSGKKEVAITPTCEFESTSQPAGNYEGSGVLYITLD